MRCACRDVALRASRIQRAWSARSAPVYDSELLDEQYGGCTATLTRGSAVGELSTVALHSAMRHETAVAGGAPARCWL